jgi:tetracycline 7-halogenase / FADH2 O2-dependent halogenase
LIVGWLVDSRRAERTVVSSVEGSYDIVVIGSGIAGSIAALVLQQAGCKTLVIERKTHPRFVIGESTIPTTALLLRHLASTYDIPEIAQVAHYLWLRDNKCAAWPKQHFWYGVHREGTPLEPRHESQFETLLLPVGPDVHMLRADADAFLASRLEAYGVDYVEHTELLDFAAGPDGIRVTIEGPMGKREVRANFLVDASGHASFLAKRFGLRDEDARLRTNTRSIFGHFKGVRELDDALGGFNNDYRFRRSAGTMHHCFPGGWIWVIPFDNGVTSVGLQKDRRMYPLDERITAEQELAEMFEKYPSMKAHLGDMTPVRPIIRSDRVQFTTSSILGDGFILTPHASAFIEPLFSTGIVLTLSFVSRFARAAREARDANDWNIERFRFIERLFFAEVAQIDRLVNGTIQSFRNYDVFKQYWRNWIIATLSQFGTCILANGTTREHPMLYAAGIRGFPEDLERMHEMVCAPHGDPTALAHQLKAIIDPWWEKLCLPTLWSEDGFAVGSARAVCVRGGDSHEPRTLWLKKLATDLAYLDPSIDHDNAQRWLDTFAGVHRDQLARYAASKADGSDFHRAYDRILWNENPNTFDYARAIGLK